MYDGSLACGDWEALVTMQQLIVLADEEGVVDMTPIAIHRRTTIPEHIIEKGLDLLAQPDENSRSKAEEGRRIVLLDPERNWGWRLVNYKYYRDLANRADKREKDRIRMQEKRNEINNVANSRSASRNVPKVAYTNTNTDTNKRKDIGRFAPPTYEEVKSYCEERGNSIDPQRFIDHYEANGWMRGKTKIKNWRACVRTWEKGDKKPDFGVLE
jgi:hypothetical protein